MYYGSGTYEASYTMKIPASLSSRLRTTVLSYLFHTSGPGKLFLPEDRVRIFSVYARCFLRIFHALYTPSSHRKMPQRISYNGQFPHIPSFSFFLILSPSHEQFQASIPWILDYSGVKWTTYSSCIHIPCLL